VLTYAPLLIGALDEDVPRNVVLTLRAAVLIELDPFGLKAPAALFPVWLVRARRLPPLRDAASALQHAVCEFGKCSSIAAARPTARAPIVSPRSVTLNVYAEEFDKAMHRDDLMARINQAGFGAVETSC
jgi:hypothetical protein